MSLAIQRAKYTGDPGFFGDIFSGIKGGIKGAIGGFIGAPVPAAPIAGPGSVPFPFASGTFNPPFAGAPGVGFSAQVGTGGQMTLPGMPPMVNGGAGGMKGMAGYHPNKTGYFLKSGAYVAPNSKWVKNRKRNPANARATSRAITRVKGAKRYAQSLNSITIRKKKC